MRDVVLSVPYFKQYNEFACGAAAFEMVFRYLKPKTLSKFSQAKMYAELSEAVPNWFGAFRITTDNIVDFAKRRGLHAGWGRAHPTPERFLAQLELALIDNGIPLIACQRLERAPNIGHFRVVIGWANPSMVILNDPEDPDGAYWPLDRFLDYWRSSPGGNVTGGVAIWIAKKPVDLGLLPDQPNPWADNPVVIH